MRWSYILPRLVLLVLIWAFFFFAFDPLLKWSLVKGIEKGVGAKAEIAGVRTSFIHPSFRLTGVTVGDPGDEFSNLAEFSELKFDIAGKPLLEKKFIVEEASLNGLRFGTPRKTSARLLAVKDRPSPAVAALTEAPAEMAVDKYADIKAGAAKDLTVSVDSLGSVRIYEELSRKFESDYAALMEKADFKEYQARIGAIQDQYEKAKGQKDILKKAKEFAKIEKDVKKLSGDFRDDRRLIESTAKDLKEGLKAADEARKKDMAAVMAKMKMPSLDAASLARMLAGPAAAGKVRTALRWLDIARKYMPDNPKKKILSSEAKRGRTVSFPKAEAYPAFLIKKMAVSGELGTGDPLEYSGAVEGITTEPRIYGRPLTAAIKGRKAGRALDFTAVLDNTGDTMKAESRFMYSGIAVADLKLGNAGSIGAQVTGGTGAVDGSVKLEGDKLDGSAEYRITGAKVTPEASAVKYAPLRSSVENTLSGVSSIGIGIKAGGTIKDPSISLKTDLADKISGAFRSAFGAELEKARAQAQEKVDAALKPYREKLDKLTSEKQRELDGKVQAAEKKVSGFGDDLLKKLKDQAAPGGKVKLPKIKL